MQLCLYTKLCILFFLYSIGKSFAQKPFSVTIQLPKFIPKQNVVVAYDNGKQQINIKPNYIKNAFTISGIYYSRYATIMIKYQDSKRRFEDFNNFWVSEKPARIIFLTSKSVYPLDRRIVKNSYELRDMGEKRLRTFTHKEKVDFINFYKKNETKIANNDSITASVYEEKSQLLHRKTMEFIKNNKNLYYSFWYFRKGIISNSLSDINTLVGLYNEFPDSLKNSTDGKHIENILAARSLKNNDQAPVFTITDITNKSYSLHQFKEKYLLLVFWASWCAPCLKELPNLKQIQDHYWPDKLAVIGITNETNSLDLHALINKHDLNWIQVFGNREVAKQYGVMAIPEIYLIDPSGIIRYKRQAQDDVDLKLLNKILADSF